MKFYTYIGLQRNKIYVREFSGNEEYSYSENFQPTMYLHAPSDKCLFKTLDGQQLASLKFDNIASCKDYIKQYKGVAEFPVYGNTNYAVQYISEKYPNKFQWNMNKIRIYTLDIETECENGFPDINKAAEKLICVTIKNHQNK